MRVRFTKMHGLGNDFAVLDAREAPFPQLPPALVRRLADRQTGIGFDQLVLLEASHKADLAMRFFNADGSEAEACGNGSRAVARYLGKAAAAETAGGVLRIDLSDDGARVDMGRPRFGWEDIPLAYAMDTAAMPVAWDELQAPDAVNVGNPHLVFFVPDALAIDLTQLGPLVENDPVFPERINVNIAAVGPGGVLSLRTWERGAGMTRACGSGACASAVAAIRRKLAASPVEVSMEGGSLAVEWALDRNIIMTGPAKESYRGSFEWDDYA
jgi:diaminopimelate epimerase